VKKSELVQELADNSRINVKVAEKVVHIFFDTISDGLSHEERAELRGFGSFTVRDYQSYMGRNPKSGQAIEVSPKRIPIFRPGKDLRSKVNRGVTPGWDYDRPDREIGEE
jgi:integration host factor subunit beta